MVDITPHKALSVVPSDESENNQPLSRGERDQIARYLENSDRPLLRLFSGFGIAIVTLMGYLAAYAYEVGYARVLHIPTYFIRIDMTNGLAAVLILVGVSLTCLPGGYFFVDDFGESAQGLTWSIAMLVIVALSLYGGILLPNYWKTFLKVIGIVLGWAALLFVSFGRHLYLARRARRSHANKRDAEIVELLWLYDPKHRRGLAFALMIFLGLMITEMAFLRGQVAASERKTFLTKSGSPNLIIVRRYGDLFIGYPIYKAHDEIDERWFQVIHVGEDKSKFGYEELGEIFQRKNLILFPWKGLD